MIPPPINDGADEEYREKNFPAQDDWARKIEAMLDEMEQTRTINAPVMVAALRKAVRELEWYSRGHKPETLLTIGGDLASQALCSIEQILLGGGGLGKGENASPKEATDNDAGERQRGGNGDA